MMRSIQCLFLGLLLSACSPESPPEPKCGEKVTEHHGNTSLENTSFKVMKVYGNLELCDAEGQKLEVLGNLKARRVTIDNLKVLGTSDIHDGEFKTVLLHGASKVWHLTVADRFECFGPLKTEDNSHFKGPVLVHGELCATNTTFDKTACCSGEINIMCNVKGHKLVVRKNNQNGRPQRLILENAVFDVIEFEGDLAYLEIRSPSKVGKVIGKKVYKH